MKDAPRLAHGFRRRPLSAFTASLLLSILTLGSAWAGPEGGVIRRGDGHIVRPDMRTTNVHQNTQRMVVDWQSFNVAADEQVNFLQPNSNAATLNRIFDQDPSRIFGQINADGRVLLSNANGIVFGESAAVNVGSLIASGLAIDVDQFMAGNISLHSDRDAPGAVINHGLVHAADGGHVGLIGGAVENSGVIIANYGSIDLANGRAATVDFDGDGLIQFAVSEDVLENGAGVNSAVNNTGTLRADGGVVAMSGHVANEIFSQVVNNDGVIAARGVSSDGGRVFLSGVGGDVVNHGTIDVSSEDRTGGYVEITGDRVGLFGDAVVDASGATGGGEVLVGGDFQGKGGVATAEMTVVGPGAVVDASARQSGDGGKVIVWADGEAQFRGLIDTSGATGGTAGFVETSGKETLHLDGTVVAAEWLLDPRNVTIADPSAGDDTSGGSFDGGNPDTFTPSADDAIVDASVIVSALNGGTDIMVTTSDATGSQAGNITVDAPVATTAAGATLTLQADGGIFVNQSITDSGAGLNVVLTAAGDVAVAADITTNGGNFDSSGSAFSVGGGNTISTGAGNIVVNHAGAITIDGAINSGGDIALTAGGDITDNAGAGTISATGTLSLDAGGNNVALQNASNAIGTLAASNVANMDIVAGSSIILGDITASGYLNVTASAIDVDGNVGFASDSSWDTSASSGAIGTTSGGIDASGAVLTLNTNGADVTLDGANNLLSLATGASGSVGLLRFNDTTRISFETLNAAGLDITAADHITSNTSVTVTGDALFDPGAGNAVSFTGANHDFQGAVSIVNAGDVLLRNTGSIQLGNAITGLSASGDLAVRSESGSIADGGTVSVGGNTTLTLGNNSGSILLDDPGNHFDDAGTLAVASSAGGFVDFHIVDDSAIILPALTLSGNLTVNAQGAITDSGDLVVAGITDVNANGSDIALDSAGNDFATLRFDGNQVSILDSAGTLTLGQSAATWNSVIQVNGDVNQSGAINTDAANMWIQQGVNGVNITLDNPDNDFSQLLFATAGVVSGDIEVVDSDDIRLGSLNTSGNLTVTAGGDVTQSGTIKANTGSTYVRAVDGGGVYHDVDLGTGANNDFGQFRVDGNNVSVNDAGNLVLGQADVVGGYTVTTGGILSQVGAVAVGGTLSIDAGGNAIDLQNDNNNVATLTVSNAGNLDFHNASALDLVDVSTTGYADFVINNGDLTQSSGTVSMNGQARFTLDGDGANLLLGTDGNHFGGVVEINGAGIGQVQINDDSDLTLSGFNATGDVAIEAGGAVGQVASSAITIGGTLTANANSGASNLILDETGNDFNVMAVTANAVSLKDANALDLAASTINDTLNVSSGAGVTDSGALTVAGAAEFGLTSGSLVLDAANDFQSTVKVTQAVDVSLNDIDALALGDMVVSGAIDIDAGGDIGINGVLQGGNNNSISVISSSGAILLDSFNGQVTAQGSGQVTLDAQGGQLDITNAVSSDTGDITLYGTGGGSAVRFSAAGNVNTAGNIAVTASGADSDIVMVDGAVIGAVTAPANVTLLADRHVLLGQVHATGQATVTATNGAIFDNTAADGVGNENVAASRIQLVADSGIGTGADPIYTDATDVTANWVLDTRITSAGNIEVEETGEVRFRGSSSNGNVNLQAGGNIYLGQVTADTTDDVVDIESLNGNIDDMQDDPIADVTASSIILSARNGNIGGSPLAGTFIADSEGAVELQGNFTLDAGDIAVADKSGADNVLSMTGSNISFTSDGNIFIDSIVATGNVSLVSAGNINDRQDDDVIDIAAGGSVSLSAAGAIGGAAQDGAGVDSIGLVEIESGTAPAQGVVSADAAGGDILLDLAGKNRLESIDAASGNIDIRSADALELDTVTAAGTVNLETAAGGITDISGATSDVGGTTVTLTSRGSIGSSTNRIRTTADTLDISVLANSGDVHVRNSDAVTLADVGTHDGLVDILASGKITAEDVDTSNTDTDSNDITLSGTSIEIGTIDSGSTGDISLAATAGDIDDVGGNASITGDDLKMIATTDIGGSNALATTVNEIVQADAGAAMAVTNSGALKLADINSTGGGVTITSTGKLTAVDVVSTSTSDADDIHLSGAGIVAGSIKSSGQGDVTLDAGNGALADGNGGSLNITADHFGASARAGVDLDIDVNELSVTVTGTGNADLASAGSFNLTGVSVADGSIHLASSGTITLSSDVASAGHDIFLDGEVALNGAARQLGTGGGTGDIRITGGVAGNDADLSIDAGAGSLVLADMAGVDSLALDGNGITLGGVLAVDSIDFSGLSGAMLLADDGGIQVASGDIVLDMLDGIDAASGASASLLLHAAGSVDISAVDVGAGAALAGLDVAGTDIRVGKVRTTGSQLFAGNLALADGRLASSGGSITASGPASVTGTTEISAGKDVKISGPVDGSGTLTVNAGDDVIFADSVGASAPLKVLRVSAAETSTRSVTARVQEYAGATRVNGDLAGDSITFDGRVRFPAGALVVSDSINFAGGERSVSGGGELTLVPATEDVTVVLGGSGGDLNLSASALNGYDGGLVIGGIVTPSAISPVAGEIDVAGSIDVGSGYLTLVSKNDIGLVEGELAGGELTLVASGPDGSIHNDGDGALLKSGSIILVAGGVIGEEGNDIQARGTGGGSTLQVASGASQASIETRGTLQEMTGSSATLAVAIADLLGLNLNSELQVTSSAQSSANREQGGGLTEEGFIDASLFEEISLYETAGTGILLPLDQEEEMPETGCSADEPGGRMRCSEDMSEASTRYGRPSTGAPR